MTNWKTLPTKIVIDRNKKCEKTVSEIILEEFNSTNESIINSLKERAKELGLRGIDEI